MRQGADAFVRDGAGQVLLVRRADDGRWAMPGGWVEPGEDAAGAAVRETLEETGLIVEGPRLVHVQERERSRHSTYACRLAGGVLTPSGETPEVAFIDPATVTRWHADHGRRVAAAMKAVS